VSLTTGILGGIAGLAAYALYEIEVIGVDTSANLILFSVLCALLAIPIGLLGARWARRRGHEPVLAQAGAIVGAGTLSTWFVVLVYALGR
jgi:hypothetical protein